MKEISKKLDDILNQISAKETLPYDVEEVKVTDIVEWLKQLAENLQDIEIEIRETLRDELNIEYIGDECPKCGEWIGWQKPEKKDWKEIKDG